MVRLRVVVDVVHPRQPRNRAEDRVVRSSQPPQEVQNGQSDRGQHAVEHAEPEHPGCGQQRQDQLAEPEPADPPELGTSTRCSAA